MKHLTAVVAHRRHKLLFGIEPSITYSTLTASAASFVAGGAGVTITFTAKDANDEVVPGYTPQPEAGVV